MAEYKICFSVAGAFGAQIRFEAKPGVSYEDAAAALDKDKLAKLICLDTLGYSAKDIEIITPEQYEAEFGGDDSGRYTFPGGGTAVRCTECGCALTVSEYHLNNWNYCPVCGAKMDGERKDGGDS